MKILIAEDDVANAKFLSKYLSKFGDVVITPDGITAVDEFVNALEKGELFELVCLDIMMPKIDGYKVLASIRSAERKHGVSRMLRSKVIMTAPLTGQALTVISPATIMMITCVSRLIS